MLNPLKNSDLSPSMSESPGAVPVSDTESGLRVGMFFMEGWIKLYRKIRDNWIWQDPVKFQWWIDILLEVNHSANKVAIGFDVYECGRGQSVRSLQGWANRWRVSKDTARNFLAMLEKDGMILHESLQKTTRITVCNYNSYQIEIHDKQTNSKRKANDKLPKQEGKELKNELGWDGNIEIYNIIATKYPKLLKMKLPLSFEQYQALIEKWGAQKVNDIFSEMQNYSELLKKNDEAGRTAHNWLRRNEERTKK